jgi:hypothetical protein
MWRRAKRSKNEVVAPKEEEDEGILRHIPSTYMNGTRHTANGKVVPVHTMKVYRQSRGIAPHILKSSTRLR